MHVDRTRFLLLTSALAAACGPKIAPGGRPPAPEVAGGSGGSKNVVDVPDPPEDPKEAPDEPVPTSGCDDMAGNPPSCSGMRVPGPACEQGMNVPENVCDAIAEVVKPRVAEALMTCLVERSRSGGTCGPSDSIGDCATRALDKVCQVDSSYEQDCKDAAARCARYRAGRDPLSTEQCMRMVSATLPSERQRALSCISEGCGVDWCFVSLAWNKVR